MFDLYGRRLKPEGKVKSVPNWAFPEQMLIIQLLSDKILVITFQNKFLYVKTENKICKIFLSFPAAKLWLPTCLTFIFNLSQLSFIRREDAMTMAAMIRPWVEENLQGTEGAGGRWLSG